MDIKNPERRTFYIIMIISVSVLFAMLIKVLSSDSSDCKTKSATQERIFEEVVRVKQGKNDSLQQVIFNITLQSVIDKDRFSKQLDSIIEKQQKR